jgi:hypothetical protein
MKHTFPLLLLILLADMVFAQEPIVISDDTLLFGQSYMPGYSVVIPEADYDNTMKEWIKKLQSGTKSSVVNEDGRMTIFGARIKTISENPLNVYSVLTRQDSSLILQSAFELKKDQFTGSAEYESVRSYLLNFAKERYLEIVSRKAEVERTKLRGLQRKMAALQRVQDRLQGSDKKNLQIMYTEKERLPDLKEELNAVSSDISDYNNRLRSMSVEEINSMGPHYLKNLERKKKRTESAIRTSETRLGKAEKILQDNRIEIPENIRSQESLRPKLSEQESIVRQYEDKLEIIKGYK